MENDFDPRFVRRDYPCGVFAEDCHGPIIAAADIHHSNAVGVQMLAYIP